MNRWGVVKGLARGWRTGVSPSWRRLRGLAVVLAAIGAGLPAVAVGQDRPVVAAAFVEPAQFVLGLHQDLSAPGAAVFAEHSRGLAQAVQALCRGSGPAQAGLAAAQARWRETMLAWESLSALAIGPIVERRSLRAIDFLPTRPRLIEQGIRRAPRTPADLERTGTPGKGLPALEWLLWTRPVQPGTSACDYAGQLAGEIVGEAEALAEAFATLAGRDWNPRQVDGQEGAAGEVDAANQVESAAEAEPAVAAMSEVVNQWVGGLERLRWQRIERPIKEAETRGSAPAFARAASGQDVAAWQAAWRTLRRLAVGDAVPAGAARQEAGSVGGPRVPRLVSIEAYLRGRGLNPAADALHAAVLRADQALAGIDPAQPKTLSNVAARLAELKRQVEGETAPALKVHIGFSDADGD